MAKPDPYADIDFEEINEQTNLANDEIKCLKVVPPSLPSAQVCFNLFDVKKQDFLSGDDLGDIMRSVRFCQLLGWIKMMFFNPSL